MESKTAECVLKVDAKRLWNGMVKDGHNLIPKVVPDVFSSVTLSNGDGGPGTIMEVTCGPKSIMGSGECMKEKVELLDDEKMVYKYSLVEGGPLGKALKSATFEVKLEPRSGGGCVGKNTCTFERVQGVEADPSKSKYFDDANIELARAVDEYLLAHPDLYA